MALHMRYYCFSIDVPPGDEPEKYIVLPFFWVPEDAIPPGFSDLRDEVPINA